MYCKTCDVNLTGQQETPAIGLCSLQVDGHRANTISYSGLAGLNMWRVACTLCGLEVHRLCTSRSNLPALISSLDPVGWLCRLFFRPCLYCVDGDVNRFKLKKKNTICSGEGRTFQCWLKCFGCPLCCNPETLLAPLTAAFARMEFFAHRASTPHSVFVLHWGRLLELKVKLKLLYLPRLALNAVPASNGSCRWFPCING